MHYTILIFVFKKFLKEEISKIYTWSMARQMMWCNVHKSVHFTASNFILLGHSGMEEQNINDNSISSCIKWLELQSPSTCPAESTSHSSSWITMSMIQRPWAPPPHRTELLPSSPDLGQPRHPTNQMKCLLSLQKRCAPSVTPAHTSVHILTLKVINTHTHIHKH